VSADSGRPPRPLGALPKALAWALLGVAALLVAAVCVAAVIASRPAFFARYPRIARNYTTLESSAHKGLRCDDCHAGGRNVVVREAALVADFYRGLFGKPRTPSFVRLAEPTNDECLACHRYDWSMEATRTMKVPHPAHLRVASETRPCVTCHRWVAHEETYTQQHKAMPFSVVCASFPCHVGVKPAADCGNCHHQLQPSLDVWRARIHPQVVRSYGPNACLEQCHTADQCRTCHTTGRTPVLPGTIADQSSVSAIERAHVKPDWLTQHGGFALQDQTKCLTCHVSEGECQDCHSKRPAFHGSQTTWLAAHQPLGKANRQRCLTCHQESWCTDCHNQFKAMR
jgi:hypothetical protein